MKRTLSITLIVLVTLYSCSKNENEVKLLKKNFSSEVSLDQALEFTFDKALIPDSIIGTWSDFEYISFQPEIKGRYYWESKSKLVFAPKNGLAPATKYSTNFTRDLLKHNPKLELAGETKFDFHSPLAELVSSRAYWKYDENTNEQGIWLEMDFNYAVSPSEVTELLDLKIADEFIEPKLVSDESSDKISYMVSNVGREDMKYPISIRLNKGLTPIGGSTSSKEVYSDEYSIPSPTSLEITDIQSSHDGMEGSLNLYTSQMANKENIRKYISISPSVQYTVEVEPGYILIRSEYFDVDKEYKITIKEGLGGTLGGKLKYEYNQPVTFGEVEPTIRFAQSKEFYVSGAGSRNVQVAILNVPKVDVKVTKVYENNIIAYLNNSYSDYYYDYDYDDYYYSAPSTGDLGDVVYEKEIDTKTLPKKGSNRVLSLDFEDKLKDNKGIYVLQIKSAESYYPRVSKMLSISDIGLIAKSGDKQIMVFANSIKTAEPIANAEITFIGRNNQVTHKAKTDKNGMAVFEYSELKAPGFSTKLVTARSGEDFNMLPLDKTRINTSRFDVGGKYPNPSGMEAFLYAERDLYRPGETVNISSIVRDQKWKTPGEIPVVLKFVAPNGKVYKTIRKTLNTHGSFETSIKLPSSAQTGSYIANLYSGNEILIGSKVIKVEEFMPDRIKVSLEISKEEYKPGEKFELGVEAVNFFGPPAANRNYEVELSTKRIGFYPKKYRRYNFYIHGARSSFSNVLRQGKTDSVGKAYESLTVPSVYKDMGLLRTDAFVTVFDETGRPVNRLKNFKIITQDVFYGINNEDYYVKTNQPVKVDLIALDKDGNALTDVEARVQLIRYEWKTVVNKSGKYYRYKSEKIEHQLEDKVIKLYGTATNFGFVPQYSGEYEIRVYRPGAKTYVREYLYAYGWGSTSYGSFKVDNEGQIDIEVDKESYKIGETANLLFKAPFSGKMLITLETDKVLDYYYVETDKRAASISIDLKKEYLPNVYVSATLFRPHEQSDIPLTVAHGYASLKVEDPSTKIPIKITAVEKSRSNTSQTIKVKAKPNSALTLAVVDEGILQVARMSTPDPYSFYYRKRALQVESSNLYPYLFPEIGSVKSSTGGDGGNMAERLNPIQNKRVKLVSYWSGILETNNKGEAEYTIDIPQFSGDLRIMAVSYGEDAFGSAQENMKVADPLVTSVALPRFLSPGDLVKMPVTLTNTTDKETSCTAKITVEGPLKIKGSASQTVTIPANQEAQVHFVVEAEKAIGEAKVSMKAQAMGETFTNVTDIAVRPASPLQKRSDAGSIKAGDKIDVSADIGEFIPASVKGKLLVSKNPLAQFANSLDYLVRYPYGCVEQTVSAAFPQLYFGDLVGTVFKSDKAANDAVRNIQHALDRIKLMQLYNGGLTYWPGSGSETWWGSAYAAHFAVEAMKAGYEVDDDFLKPLLKYLKNKLQRKELVDYYFNRDKRKKIAPREAIYSLYILALAGEKPTALLNYYSTRTENLSLDSKYMLAAAYSLIGKQDKAEKILPDAFTGEVANTSFGGSFYSAVRDEALALNVLLEIDPDNPQIGTMVRHVSNALKNRRYLNTQERSFSLMALGKIARRAAASDIKGQIKVGGSTVASFDNNDVTIDLGKYAGKNIEITTKGKGDLYYYWETQGISADGSFIQEDNYMKVRKTFYDRNGNEITGNRFKQNDLVLVRLKIVGATGKYIDNVAISDILPACFEIENPRLTTLPPGMSYPTSRSYPDYMDIRDDRINLFTQVGPHEKNFYYLVRVVSKGEYVMGPVGADAMYNGEYHSYHGAGTIIAE